MQSLLILLLLLSLTIFSCATNEKKRETESGKYTSSADTTQKGYTSKTKITPQTSSLDTNTLIIDRKEAVFYQPDSLQMEKRMKEVGQTNFKAGADDYIYYANMSVEYLQKKGLPVLNANNKKYLKFELRDKQVQLIKLDTLKELWGMYLFDPKKKPYAADMTMIEREYKNYYK